MGTGEGEKDDGRVLTWVLSGSGAMNRDKESGQWKKSLDRKQMSSKWGLLSVKAPVDIQERYPAVR